MGNEKYVCALMHFHYVYINHAENIGMGIYFVRYKSLMMIVMSWKKFIFEKVEH
jgi:hypothetical protein